MVSFGPDAFRCMGLRKHREKRNSNSRNVVTVDIGTNNNKILITTHKRIQMATHFSCKAMEYRQNK